MKKKNIVKLITGIELIGVTFAYGNDNRPNVVFVLVDQMRNSAMNFWSQPEYEPFFNYKADPVHTPVLDSIARQSVVLTSAQSTFPLSSPYRGMMLTGMYMDNNGITQNCNNTRPFSSLKRSATAISDVFSQGGYSCAYFGKLHADYPTKNSPQNPGKYVEDIHPVWDAYTPPEDRHGFNYWYSYGTYDVHKHPHYWDTKGNRHEISEWSPQHEADKVIDFLKNKTEKDKPFFIVWSTNPPHSPYNSLDDCMEKDFNLYKNIPLDSLLVRPNINPELTDKQKCAPYYFASVTGVDREFGRVLKQLHEQGLDENTIVVFTADHGETMASHVLDAKNSAYNESMNVPFMIRYPEKLMPKVSRMMLTPVDIMPTLLSLAGMKKEIPASVEGKDLSLYLRNGDDETIPKAVLYFSNIDGEKDKNGIVKNYFANARGIKTDEYTLSIKIDKKGDIREILFFNDKKDPYQMNNLSVTENSKVFNQLCQQMGSMLREIDDQWYRKKVLNKIIPY